MFRILIGISCTAVLAGCLFGGNDESPGFDAAAADRALAARISAIQEGLSELRGLRFHRPLHSAVITPEAYRRNLDRSITQSTPPALDRALSRELAQLGYFPDTSLRISSLWSDFYGSFPAGYYLPGRDSIVILSNYLGDEQFLRLALPHELQHALQDQHLDVFNPERPDPSPRYYAGDFGLAFNCLVEGDAELTAHAYYAKTHLGAEDPLAFAREEAARRDKGHARWARMTRTERLFAYAASPYDVGMSHAADLHAQGGFAAVDAQYAAGERSTHSVLTGTHSDPEPVDLDWLPRLLDTAGAYVDDFGMGSLQLMTLYYGLMTREQFDRGLGWRGDRLFYRLRPGERWGSLVWVQAFATEADARNVHAYLRELLPTRFWGMGFQAAGRVAGYPGAWDEGLQVTAMDLPSVVIRKGRDIWWVEGTGALTGEILDSLAVRRPTARVAGHPGVPGGGLDMGLIKVAGSTAGLTEKPETAATKPRRSGIRGPDLDMRFLHSRSDF
jgi:hypothetical protein